VDEVVGSFPSLTRAQFYECLAYYEDHQSEFDPLVAAQTANLLASGEVSGWTRQAASSEWRRF
jgi:hypothetical protein